MKRDFSVINDLYAIKSFTLPNEGRDLLKQPVHRLGNSFLPYKSILIRTGLNLSSIDKDIMP